MQALMSAPILQRLPEKDSLDLNTAVKKADMLELTKRQSDTFDMSHKCSFPTCITIVERNKIFLSPSEKKVIT